MEGYINLYRQILDSAVFASEKRLKLWIWLLCKANYKDRFVSLNIGRGESVIELKRGQVLFGRFKAEEETGIDGSTIYKILKWFENENMISIKSNTHYTVLTVCNYDTYNIIESEKVTANEQQTNSQVTANEQPSNTPKKDKKDKKDKKITYPTIEDVKNYFKENGYNEQTAIKMFNSYSIADWKDSKGKQVLNWKQKAINVWFKDENKIKQQPAKKISYYDEFNGTN